MIKSIKYFFEAILIYFFLVIGKLIGLYGARKLFSFIFKKIGPFVKSRNIINKNLNRFLKKNSEESKNEIISNMWSNYGMTFIEYIFLNKFRNENSHINIEGEKILDDISNSNKPVIFISGHFANFELMSMEITKKKINLATIYRPLNNFFLNPFMEYLRKNYICKTQIKKGLKGVREALTYFKRGKSLAIMIDQRVTEGIDVKLFGKNAFTTTIPAQFVKKFGCLIQPVYIERINSVNFKVVFDDHLDFNNDKNIENITKKLNQWLEDKIIKNPDQWIWTHDRWKH